jgi:hypothetical protein
VCGCVDSRMRAWLTSDGGVAAADADADADRGRSEKCPKGVRADQAGDREDADDESEADRVTRINRGTQCACIELVYSFR